MKRTLFLVATLMVSIVLTAAPVSREQAQQQARQFLVHKNLGGSGRHAAPLNTPLSLVSDEGCYVFNVGQQQGFVIVSSDDRTPAVLGYADSGTFSPEDIPANMRAWLQGYDDQLQWLGQQPETTAQQAPLKAAARRAISPLLSSQWNQYAPYNNQAPAIDGNQCLTGCVATAMAQVMFYHKWPTETKTEIPAYTSNTTLGTLAALPATTFRWADMQATYGSSYSSESGTAVAKLMRYCGQSVQMNYGTGVSMADTRQVATALKQYFDYDNTAKSVERLYYTSAEWNDLIYAEMAAGRPVVYGGQSTGGGHAFVIDGYDENDYFHINWGWGGQDDGFFLLSVANPYSNSGAGASSSKDGYSYQQNAVIGIQKQAGTPEAVGEITCLKLLATETSGTYYSNGYGIPITFIYGNYSGIDLTFNIGFGIFDADNTLKDYNDFYSTSLPNGWYSNGNGTCVLGANLPDGTYTIKGLYRLSGSEEWLPQKNADQHAITAVINGNSMTLTNAEQPTIKLAGTGITATGTLEPNNLITLSTNITNSGTGFFNGYLYLFVNGSKAGGKVFELEGGQTAPFSIEYTPNFTGTAPVKICTDEAGTNVIAEGTLTIQQGAAATSNVDLSLPTTIINLSSDGKYVYGTKLHLKTVATNNTATPYSGRMGIQLYKWTRDDSGVGYSYSGIDAYQNFSVPANGTQEVYLTADGLEEGAEYSLSVFYLKGSEWQNEQSVSIRSTFIVKPGYSYYDAEGKISTAEATSALTLPSTATCVDLRGQNTVTSLSGADNPNLLVFVDADGTVPTGATNVVKGGQASQLTLADRYPFYTPETFTAQTVTYIRTFTQGFNRGSSGGWATVCLPFTATEVSTAEKTIDWFHSATDTGKHFWLMEYAGENGSDVVFDYAPQLDAYTPYIIAMPGSSYGTKWDLTNRAITFSGTNATIQASSSAVAKVSGQRYKFVGALMQTTAPADAYVLNDAGDWFEATTADATTVSAFHAYFQGTGHSAASAGLNIRIGQSEPTAILTLGTEADRPAATGSYDLQGRRVSSTVQPGLYIVNGKKVIVK